MRAAPAAALLAMLAALAGCDAIRSFESVCERRLPPTRVVVEAEPVAFTVDHSLSFSQLTAKGAVAAEHGRSVLGLTQANLGSEVSVRAPGVSSPLSGRYCMRPEVKVKVSFNPMKIYMGSDEREGSCGYRITWEHELRHVAVYQEFLPEFAARIEARLASHFGNAIYYFKSADEAKAHVDELVNRHVGPLVQDGMREVRVLQRNVDSASEYARIAERRSMCDR